MWWVNEKEVDIAEEPKDYVLWPDGVWCHESELDEYLIWRSDDYMWVSEKTLDSILEQGVHP